MLFSQTGSWRTYMAYHDIAEVEKAGNIVYVLASNNLYAYNTNDQSIQTYDKVNFLNDCTINHIAWCQSAQRLIILYSDNNIDLIDRENHVVNLPDYYMKSMIEDKTVNDIYIEGSHAYLSTNFGILKINVKDAEISDTYNLGFLVDYCYIENGKIYAASHTKGIYSAKLTDNLLDKNSWTYTKNYQKKNKTIDEDLLTLIRTLDPDGPKYNYFHFMKFVNGSLYTTGGMYSGGVQGGRPGCIQVMKDGEWTIYEDELESKTGIRYTDINGLSIDPKDNNHVVAFGRTGLYEFHNGQYTNVWTYTNSPLKYAAGLIVESSFKNYVLVLGATFDDEGNLWCMNSQTYDAKSGLLRLSEGSQWTSFHKSSLICKDNYLKIDRTLGSMENAMFDSRHLLWFVNNHWDVPSVYCYNTVKDELKSYTRFINEDGTRVEAEYVRCVAEDKDGNLWIGTNVGPIYLSSTDIDEDVSSTTFMQVKVPRNDGTNLADYLLGGVDITCMAIDGGNRKWFGTANSGVYLISSDNLEQIHHFTSSNSSLISDNIESVAINQSNGEVFFGTDKGLCSFMSDATETNEDMTKDNVWAYPNPVRPDYNGPITVTGLSYNSYIKIVASSGSLVAEGRSNGGSFTWDGCDKNGKRVASGVYMVETATEEGKKGTVCKIAIVN